MNAMTTSTTNPALSPDTAEALLQAPLSNGKASLLLNTFRLLNSAQSPSEAATACRLAASILTNLSYHDAHDYATHRSDYSTWFFGQRKKLINSLNDHANYLDSIP